MAVYRCEVKTLSRTAGRSAVAAAAYRAADRLRDDRANDGQGKDHDYRRRGPGVAYAEIITPSGAPTWAIRRGQLWNAAEAAENRKNSVTAREVLLSLPHELDDQQRAELVRGFASRLVERYGVAVDLAIHRPDRKGDNRNHHAHLMMTTRRMTAEGLKEKTRQLDDVKKRGPEEIEAIRELWEKQQNQALRQAGREERVSRLSNQAQGIDREPQPKLGEAATALMRQGQPTRLGERWKDVANRNAMRANANQVMRQRAKEEARPPPSPMRANMAQKAARERAERLAREHEPGGMIANALKAAEAARLRQEASDQGEVTKKFTQPKQPARDKPAGDSHDSAIPPAPSGLEWFPEDFVKKRGPSLN